MNRFECPECCYVFDEAKGDSHEGYPPGMPFDDLPDEFTCPDCSVQCKQDFVKL